MIRQRMKLHTSKFPVHFFSVGAQKTKLLVVHIIYLSVDGPEGEWVEFSSGDEMPPF